MEHHKIENVLDGNDTYKEDVHEIGERFMSKEDGMVYWERARGANTVESALNCTYKGQQPLYAKEVNKGGEISVIVLLEDR